ncbi:MAG TPA: hypothetical protein VKM69_06955 [Natronoarchaeum rubrum]|nr:hypothetical protein [Natronoarchaeum rubrum]
MIRLLIAFFSGDETTVTATSDDDGIDVVIDGTQFRLSRSDAADLQDAVGDALTERTEFFRTAGEYREDGTYEVSRRGADSAGNAKVFRDFEELRRLYERLPDAFDAEDVGRTGITGSRRHMIVRHVAEHPAFDCEIASRKPLRAAKVATRGAGDGADAAPGDANGASAD